MVKITFAIMARNIKDSEIEKNLNNFDESDISDLEDSEEPDLLLDLFDALEGNQSFVEEELSRPGTYEISVGNLEEDNLAACTTSVDDHDSDGPFKKIDVFRWKKETWHVPDVSFTEFIPKKMPKTPVEYFLEYFTEDFVEKVVDTTNQASLLNNGKSVNLKKEEFYKFLALEIMIGTISYPRLEMYWSKTTEIPCFRGSMPRVRFHSLRHNLKFSLDQTSDDKLHRIRPLLEVFYKKFYAIPKDENVCVDEMMVPFKGKTMLRQYMPKKPIKWGIKIFCLCSSKGVIYDLEIYQGKNTIVGDSKLGFCSDIVIQLPKTIPKNKNFKIYFDSYFTTLSLIKFLQQQGIWATGTIRGNRMGKAPLSSEKDLKK